MKEIELTQGFKAIVDDEDYQMLSRHKWYTQKNKNTKHAARRVYSNGKLSICWMHRVVLNADPNSIVDHVDGDGLNNCKSNLRFCDSYQNARNANIRSDNKSGFKGVSWRKKENKWTAQIQLNKKRVTLGYFYCLVKAAKAYNDAAIKHFGEFAKLNIVNTNEVTK